MDIWKVLKTIYTHLDIYFPRQLLCLAKKSREQGGLPTSNLTYNGNEWAARDIHIDAATN